MGIGRFRASGRELAVDLFLEAGTQVFLGDPPAPPAPVPLPSQAQDLTDTGLSFVVPVLAEYDLLEPVVHDALKELEGSPIAPPGVGPVEVRFRRVQLYATEGGKLALGVELEARPERGVVAGLVGPVKGVVWLTGVPVNAANSRVVRIDRLDIAARTDSKAANLLSAIMLSDEVQQKIETSLHEDFEKDYARIMGIVGDAVANLRIGDWTVAMAIERVEHGTIEVKGPGLYLPVHLSGTGRIRAPGGDGSS